MTNPDDALHPLPPAAVPAASAPPAEPAAAPLSAAKEAAAFVAKIFAEPVAEAPAQEEAQPLAETQALAPAFVPVPQDWPAQAEQPLRGQRVLVLGLGASGLAMARWCTRSSPHCARSCRRRASSAAPSTPRWCTTRRLTPSTAHPVSHRLRLLLFWKLLALAR